MGAFQEIELKWKESVLNDILLAKFQTLLTDDSEEGVKSCIELLRSFGDGGLCMVLKQNEHGQIVLKEDLGFVHRLLWMVEIVSAITEKVSVWKPLYELGAFDDMRVHILQGLGSVEWSNLSEAQQKMVVSFSMLIVEVPAGCFMMGTLPNDHYAKDDEKPQHKVTLTKGMMVSQYACTQGLYESVMGANPSPYKGATRPVDSVSWCDAVLFCNKLSEMEGLKPVYVLPDGLEEVCRNQYNSSTKDTINELTKQVMWNQDANGYRLPTEAEWEYCARGGESHLYSGSNNIDEVAWYDGEIDDDVCYDGNIDDFVWHSSGGTHAVGQKKPNAFGLYDMSGNVWEWVWDSSLRDYDSSNTNPVHIDTSAHKRVRRGGGWENCCWNTRVSLRFTEEASYRRYDQGLRFIRNL